MQLQGRGQRGHPELDRTLGYKAPAKPRAMPREGLNGYGNLMTASHGLALLKQPASGRHQQRPCRPNKKPRPRPGLFVQLVPEIGIEPTTYALRMRRSTN